jgi:hypothetical protein
MIKNTPGLKRWSTSSQGWKKKLISGYFSSFRLLEADLMINDGKLALYRRRFIPEEITLLDNDRVLRADGEIIVTKWATLKPRSDFSSGMSCYWLNKGVKVSRFYRDDGSLLFHYCDIIETERPSAREYVFNDLLADVVIKPDGFVETLDVGEIADALDGRLITREQAGAALRSLDWLLRRIYSGGLAELSAPLDIYGEI